MRLRTMSIQELSNTFVKAKYAFWLFMTGSFIMFMAYLITARFVAAFFSLYLLVMAVALHNEERHAAIRMELRRR